uniref:Cilia- and flagella-associated protein 36 n=1 Tax=Gadus morhua TaxID=8049 RepID=A0A8C5F5N5_GADMO
MAEEDWVLESIVGYLGSPEWVIPVSDFMEINCSVFDDEDENKLTYTEIHKQFKQLVEKLLDNHMQEIGINEQQFVEAYTSPFAKSKTLQVVFQPVLATDDFQMFRSLMVQKNMELQLQALRVIKERHGALPECLTDGADVMSELEQQEMTILQEVLKKSKEEYDEGLSQRRVGSTSGPCSGSRTPGEAPTQDLGSSRAQVTSKVLPVVRAPVKGGEPPADPYPGSQEQGNTKQSSTEPSLDDARREAGIPKPYTELSESQQQQVQQRAQYLREQRDKLQALKRGQQNGRKTAIPEERAPHPPPAPVTPEVSAEEKKKLQKRKHLAEKLKEEVIKK